MDNKGLLLKTDTTDILGTNTQFFKYIFKKTEKIVCAVFYITNSVRDENKRHIIRDAENSALRLLESAHTALGAREEESDTHLRDLQFGVIALESKLRILHASSLLSGDLLRVFASEMDNVLRSSNQYMQQQHNPLFEREEESQLHVTTTAPEKRAPVHASSFPQRLPNRRGRILSVLREKGQASIKDIADVIKDCSEKTIQRELIVMIKDGIIRRDGERRWSKYSLVQ